MVIEACRKALHKKVKSHIFEKMEAKAKWYARGAIAVIDRLPAAAICTGFYNYGKLAYTNAHVLSKTFAIGAAIANPTMAAAIAFCVADVASKKLSVSIYKQPKILQSKVKREAVRTLPGLAVAYGAAIALEFAVLDGLAIYALYRTAIKVREVVGHWAAPVKKDKKEKAE
jgi:hypothetical protein